MFLILLRYRLRALWNEMRFSTPRQRMLGAGLFLLSAMLALAVFGGFLLVTYIRGKGAGASGLAHEVALSVFLFLLAGSVPFLSATLLHPGDVELMGVAPVPIRSVVAVRLFEGAAAGAIQFLPIGAPAVAACAVGLGAPASTLLWLVPLAALMVLLPSCISAVALLLAVAWLGSSRVRAAVAAVNVLLGAVVCVVVVSQVTGLRLQEGLDAVLAGTSNPSGALAYQPPWAWFGQSLLALTRQDTGRFLMPLGWAALATVGLGGLALVLGERLWLGGGMADTDARVRYPSSASTAARRLWGALLSPPVLAIVGKETRYVFRDPLLLSQAGMPAILFVVPFIMASRLGGSIRLDSGELSAFSVFMVLAILYMQTSILSASSVGLEGRAFWAYLTSPNGIWTLLTAKWLASWMLAGGFSCALTAIAGLAFRAEAATVAVLCAAIAASAAGLCGIGVGASAALPRFTFENPAHRVSPVAMIIGFGAGVLYSATGWGVLGGTWYAAVQWPRNEGLIVALGAVVFSILTLLAIAIPLGIGADRLGSLEWEH